MYINGYICITYVVIVQSYGMASHHTQLVMIVDDTGESENSENTISIHIFFGIYKYIFLNYEQLNPYPPKKSSS